MPGKHTLPAWFETGITTVPLTPVDRELLQRCLNHAPGSWNEFVDRFLGLIYHVINHASHLRSVPLRPERVITELARRLDERAIVTMDAGANRLYMTHYFQCKGPGTVYQPSSVGGALFAILRARHHRKGA